MSKRPTSEVWVAGSELTKSPIQTMQERSEAVAKFAAACDALDAKFNALVEACEAALSDLDAAKSLARDGWWKSEEMLLAALRAAKGDA